MDINSLLKKRPIGYLIWNSCLEKPITLGSLVPLWGYSSSTSLYRGNTYQKLLEAKLLQKTNKKDERTGREETYYYSTFDGYKIFLEKGANSDIKLILEDWDIWKKYFESPFMRKRFYKVDNIKILIKNDPKRLMNIESALPLLTLSIVPSVRELVKNDKKTIQEIAKGNFGSGDIIKFLIKLQAKTAPKTNFGDYINVCLQDIGTEEFEREIIDLPDIEHTKYYTEELKFLIDMLKKFCKLDI